MMSKNSLNLNFPQPDYRQWLVDNVGTVYIAWRPEIPNELDANKIFIDTDSSALCDDVPVEINISAFPPIYNTFFSWLIWKTKE